MLIWIASGRHLEQTGAVAQESRPAASSTSALYLSWTSSRGVKHVQGWNPDQNSNKECSSVSPFYWSCWVTGKSSPMVSAGGSHSSLMECFSRVMPAPRLGGMRMKHRMKQGGGAEVFMWCQDEQNHFYQPQASDGRPISHGHSFTASYCIILHHTVVDGSFELIFQVLKKWNKLSFMMFHVSADLLLILCISCVVLFDVSCFLYISACSGRREEPRLLTQRMRGSHRSQVTKSPSHYKSLAWLR